MVVLSHFPYVAAIILDHGRRWPARQRRAMLYHHLMSLNTVVTGANSGIGRATAIHLADQGHRVFATVRSFQKADKLMSLAAAKGVTVQLVELDIADDDSVERGFTDILEQAGHIDVLVNNAGISGNGTVEEAATADYLDVFNVNVCGAVRCVKAVMPGMRSRRAGTIINVTSVAGRVASLAQAPYVASKWAFEAISEELAQEAAAFGIRVAIIEPGVTKTSIFVKSIPNSNETGAYEAHNRRMLQMYAAGIRNATDPMEVAAVIAHAITTESPKLRYAMSWGGPEMAAGRAAMTDEEWVALGRHELDDDYYDEFAAAFGLDLRR